MSDARAVTGWRHTTVMMIAAVGVVVVALSGAVLARPDVVVLALPLALWLVLAARERRRDTDAEIVAMVDTDATEGARTHAVIEVRSGAELVDVWVLQGRRATTEIVMSPTERLHARSTLLHSGPARLVEVHARPMSADGALVAPAATAPELQWNAAPARRPIGELAIGTRLGGLHGSHAGRRPGTGGDFRDIHPFAPGDELRRVDWRATARLAQRPGELFVRRTQSISEATIAVVLDLADDLGQVVSTWGSGDEEGSGPTSLDLGREAARAITEAALDRGDRVSYQELAAAGRVVRTASGARQRARVLSAISAARQRPAGERYRRTPVVAHSATVYVLSTFFEGAAGELATQWRAGGHRVLAVDILPEPDLARLSAAQRLAARTLLLERRNTFSEFAHAGIGVLRWTDGESEFTAQLSAVRRERRGA